MPWVECYVNFQPIQATNKYLCKSSLRGTIAEVRWITWSLADYSRDSLCGLPMNMTLPEAPSDNERCALVQDWLSMYEVEGVLGLCNQQWAGKRTSIGEKAIFIWHQRKRRFFFVRCEMIDATLSFLEHLCCSQFWWKFNRLMLSFTES